MKDADDAVVSVIPQLLGGAFKFDEVCYLDGRPHVELCKRFESLFLELLVHLLHPRWTLGLEVVGAGGFAGIF